MKRAGLVVFVATASVAASLAIAEDTKPAPSATGAAKKFNHDQHATKTKKKVVTEENCSDCHGKDEKGALAMPGQNGHQPCLASGCHAKDFLNSAASKRKQDKKAYAKAAAFCLGCHSNAKGEPPKNYQKAAPDNVYKNNSTTEYHVELDHFQHIEYKAGKCRDCHVVDATTNALVLDSPGHLECSQCHNGNTTHAMSKCAACHTTPGKNEYYTGTREGSDTRACGSESHLELARKKKLPPEQVPCFKHETKYHRFKSKKPDKNSKKYWEQGDPLQCGQCHFMFEDKKHWKRLKGRYTTLKEIRASPIMEDGDKELAHKACGQVRACHRGQTDDSSGTAPCEKCHDRRVTRHALFY